MEDNRKIIGDTKKCIVCLKKAIHFTGHVIKDNDIVFAGFCDDHINTYINKWKNTENYYYLGNMKGCYGGWMPEYGFTPKQYPKDLAIKKYSVLNRLRKVFAM